MTKNKLRIRAKSLDLELSGETEYVFRAYEAIRPVLMERFAESIEGHYEAQEVSSEEERGSQKTLPLNRVAEAPVGEPEDAQPQEGAATTNPETGVHHIKLVLSNEVYNKIYLVEREELERSVFGRLLELDTINRIYVNRSERDFFRSYFHFGKVLWRELTAAGKAAVKKSG